MKKHLNPDLKIDGVLVTMVDRRTNLSKHIVTEIKRNFGIGLNVYETVIPRTVATAEAPLEELSVINYEPRAESSLAYIRLAKEVLSHDKEIKKHQPEHIR